MTVGRRLPRQRSPGRTRAIVALWLLLAVTVRGASAEARPAVQDLLPGHPVPDHPLRPLAQEAANAPTVDTARPQRYELTATWRAAPWRLTPGSFSRAVDVAVRPDGQRYYVLDSRQWAIHVLQRDGRALAVLKVPEPDTLPGADWDWVVRRMDGAPDGTLLVLLGATYRGLVVRARVQRLGPDGADLGAFEREGYHIDLAAGPDGRLYLARPYPEDPFDAGPGTVEVLDAAGRLLEHLGSGLLSMPMGVDVSPDGVVHVINRLPSPAGQPPPAPTPLPAGGGRLDAAPRQGLAPEGISLFGADLAYQRTVPFLSAEDVGAGADGAYLSRRGEVFRMGEASPLYSVPAGQFTSQWYGGSTFRLSTAIDGRLVASVNHCHHQGAAVFAAPEKRPSGPRFHGALDRPWLEGPVFPLRLAADEGLAALQGRFTEVGRRPDVQYFVSPEPEEPQVVQQWSGGGQLLGQLGLCATASAGRDMGEVWWVRDVALDGEDTYTADADIVQRRSGPTFPDWSFWPGTLAAPEAPTHLVAVAARSGRVAVLDAGSQSVTLLARDGTVYGRWAAEDLPAGAVLGDVALGDDRVYLADRGRARILVRALDGAPLAEWDAADGPLALAAGAVGDVFLLGRSGWVQRFASDGARLAAWPLPDRALEATDIAVGADGRVFVPFVERLGTRNALGFPTGYLLDAGVWVFEPGGPGPVPVVSAGGCLAVPDKKAAPAVLPLGDEVTVRLTLGGVCPDQAEPSQLALVFDTSRSMNFDESLARAQGATMALLEALDGRSTDVALVTFDDEGLLALPLSRDLGAVRSTVAGLEAFGDTRPGLGLSAALAELTGPRARPGERQALVVVTDGDWYDLPVAVADEARAAGIEVYALAFPNGNYNDYHTTLLAQLTGDIGRSRVLVEPNRAALERLLVQAGLRRPVSEIFQRVTVVDEIPANMRLVPDSVNPPATLVGRTLRWELPAVPAAKGVALDYRLEPLETGLWPTNVSAVADYRDGVGVDGSLVFPVPQVRVWDRSSLHQRVFLPQLGNGHCFRAGLALDVALVLDTSESMREDSGQGGTKLEAARAAAARFVDLLWLGRDRVAVVGFNHAAHVALDLSGDSAAIRRALDGLASAPGTRIDLGLAAASGVLGAMPRTGARRVVVLLTDGRHGGAAADVRREAELLRQRGWRVFAIGLGGDVDEDLLRQVATSPADYLASPTAADLAAAYGRVAESLACDRP